MAYPVFLETAETAAVLIAGSFFLVFGMVKFRTKLAIQSMPVSKNRSLAMGLAKICGEVVPAGREVLTSPASGRSCVYYRCTTERRIGRIWYPVKNEENMQRFFLADGTGKVLVDPAGAKVEVSMRSEIVDSAGFASGRRIREYCISPRDRLCIIGTAGDNPLVAESTARKGREDVMVLKGRHEKFYYISDTSEKKLIEMLRMQSVVSIFVGCLSVGIGLFSYFSGALG